MWAILFLYIGLILSYFENDAGLSSSSPAHLLFLSHADFHRKMAPKYTNLSSKKRETQRLYDESVFVAKKAIVQGIEE